MGKLIFTVLLLSLAVLISGCVQQQEIQPRLEKNMSFVSAQGTEFIIDGKPFRFVGAFAQVPMTDRLYDIFYSFHYKSAIDSYLESLPPDVNVIRIFAYGPYSKSKYGYDEPNWERLDYLVRSAEAHGVYIIWALYDYWDYGPAGGLANYNFKFWQDPAVKQTILAEVTRYKGSPAIFGWEIMNEGDIQVAWKGAEDKQELLSWIEDVSNEIKAIDSRHLVSTGFSNDFLREVHSVNPDGYQAQREWVMRLYSLSNIDFVTLHEYGGNPDLQTNADFFTDEWKTDVAWFVAEMANIRNELGKPVVMEEFGTQRQVGEPVRNQVYTFMLDQAIQNNISCAFNTWADDPCPQCLSVYSYDTAEYQTIKDAAARIKT